MAMRRLKVAIIGAGIAERHLAGFARLPQLFEIVYLCALDRDRGLELCRQFGVPAFTENYSGIFARGDIDVVDICTPPNLHFAMTKEALASGHHVICEKPLFGSLAEVDAIADIVAATDRRLMPIFQYRYGKGLQKLKHLIAAGLTGHAILTSVETHWWRGPEYYAVPWRGRWRTELGGGLLGHAIHAHDMLTYVHGDITEVCAMTTTLVNPIETEDTAVLSLRMANGSLAALSMTLGSRREISRLRFCFKNVVVESILEPYTMARDPWTFVAGDADHQARIDTCLAEVADTDDGYARQFELFHQALIGGSALPVTLADARRSLELVTAAYMSQRNRQVVTLPLDKDHPLYGGWLPEP
jgi:predicted dehydrogenase